MNYLRQRAEQVREAWIEAFQFCGVFVEIKEFWATQKPRLIF